MREKRILEIGHGIPSVPHRMQRRGVRLRPNEVYIGVDRHSAGPVEYDALMSRLGDDAALLNFLIDESRRNAGELRKFHKNQNIYFVSADGKNLPFNSEAFHEVHLHNVISDPIFDNSPEAALKIVQEAHRVLKPKGHLVIVTDIAPGRLKVEDVVGLERGFKPHLGRAGEEKIKAIRNTLVHRSKLHGIHVYVKK